MIYACYPRSISISISLFLSLSVSLPLSLFIYFSLSLSLSLFASPFILLTLSVCVSLSLSVCLCLSQSLSIPLSLSLSLCVSLYFALSPSQFVFLPLSISFSYFSISLFLSSLLLFFWETVFHCSFSSSYLLLPFSFPFYHDYLPFATLRLLFRSSATGFTSHFSEISGLGTEALMDPFCEYSWLFWQENDPSAASSQYLSPNAVRISHYRYDCW